MRGGVDQTDLPVEINHYFLRQKYTKLIMLVYNSIFYIIRRVVYKEQRWLGKAYMKRIGIKYAWERNGQVNFV